MITILLAKLKAYGVGERSFILYYLLGRMITILLAKLKAYGVGERSFILYYLLGRQHRVKKKKNI